MKALILAGGFGTRLAEITDEIPKPMIEVGQKPILLHIMQIYADHGIKDFVVLLGYKGDYIKRYFLNYSTILNDFTIDLKDGSVSKQKTSYLDWKITFLDTGIETQTGGRISRAINALQLTETFCMTYGDGLSDVNIEETIKWHRSKRKLATVTAVTPPGRFGVLDIDPKSNQVMGFREKAISDNYRINGGFFVLEPGVENFINSDLTIWENEPMEALSKKDQMTAYLHDGFWHPMDTLRDKRNLESLWSTGKVPWVAR